MDNAFSKLDLPETWIQNLDQLGYLQMTPIQAQALPLLLEGRDVVGHAQTGTGKTAAFAISLLHRISSTGEAHPQALVLCPTRELALQVAEEIRRLARPLQNTKVLTLCGGHSIRPQIESLEHGADVIVGTPGRVLDHLERETLDLDYVGTLVLDEADRMLDMGFFEDVETIAEQTPMDRQTLLFSATMNEEVEHLAEIFQSDPVHISVGKGQSSPTIQSTIVAIGKLGREESLIRVLASHRPKSAVVFCNMRVTCDDVGELLEREGHSVLILHGGLEQRDRNKMLMKFDNRSACILVATDVAARGLDVEDIDLVVNYDLPKQADIFVHRIGRTGRAGREGQSVSLLDRRRSHQIDLLEEILGEFEIQNASDLPEKKERPPSPEMETIQINGGKKAKLRAGDIVGAFTNDFGLEKDDIGKITILNFVTFVAVKRKVAKEVIDGINYGRIKNRNFKARHAE